MENAMANFSNATIQRLQLNRVPLYGGGGSTVVPFERISKFSSWTPDGDSSP